MRIAIEAGTHSPWVSRVLEECGHEVLVANARKLRLIYANKRKTDEVDALRTWLAWRVWIRSYSTHSSIGGRRAKLIWPSSAHVKHWSVAARNWSTQGTWSSQILRSSLAQVPCGEFPQQSGIAYPEALIPALGPILEQR